MTTRCVVRAARAGFPKMSKANFWGCAIPKERSKVEIFLDFASQRQDQVCTTLFFLLNPPVEFLVCKSRFQSSINGRFSPPSHNQ